ncbi:PDZ domain-containing protein [Geomonas terrae]|uniref:PDZ domain-containing protein n=1 Tax=Geomonas terrae TaxID=2562681 RepID=A0A4S1C9R5_9BACT|nr:ChaN family lipoprotein [Geomonas terrae]TGU70005.1 PDZ domain-containing protein [Geomonas terrae]
MPFAARLGRLAAVLSLLAMTACSTTSAGSHVLGNPENPYPLSAPPKVGDIIHLPTGILVTPQQMNAVVTDARVVYVGETHDNPAAHRLELDVLKAMEERKPGKVALGMEMFTRSQQPVLDRWVAGELDEKSFIKQSRWFDTWRMDFGYYRDLLLFCRDKHIPVIALNAEKEIVQAVRSGDLSALTAEQKAQLPEMDLTDRYQHAQTESIFADHSHGKMAVEGFLRVQTLWDETMAETAARYLASPAGKERSLVIIAGGNHIGYGFGIPRRVFRRVPTSYVTIGGREVVVTRKEEPVTMNVDLPDFPAPPYDFLVHYAYEGLPQPEVQLGVMFEPTGKGSGLTVKMVLPDSNASRAGLQEGDVIQEMDGEPLKESFDLVWAIKQKHPGDKSKLKVERKGETLSLDVLYKEGKQHQHGKP